MQLDLTSRPDTLPSTDNTSDRIRDCMRHRLLLVALVLFGCATAPRTITRSGPTTVEAEPWPEADLLFRGDPLWLGGEGGYSIDLGNQRVLWLFGNSLIGGSGNRDRSHSTLVYNTVAVQNGYDPSLARISFEWRRSGARPGSFFRREGQDWYWPGHGILLDNVLLIFLMKVGKSEKAPGYDIYGWTAVRITNPQESPDHWKMQMLDTPANEMNVIVGSGGVGSKDGYLYALSAQEPTTHDTYLVRWKVASAKNGDLSRPEWWLGAESGWAEQRNMTHPPVPIFTGGQTELTVHEDRLTGQLFEIQTDGIGGAGIARRTSPTVTGPWSQPETFYNPPESTRPDILIQQAKAHPELHGADLVLTYIPSHRDFATIVTDTTLYYPRFVKGTLR